MSGWPAPDRNRQRRAGRLTSVAMSAGLAGAVMISGGAASASPGGATPASVLAASAGLASGLPASSPTTDANDDLARVSRQLARTRAAMETSSRRVSRAAEAYTDAARLLPDVRRRVSEANGILAGVAAKERTARRHAAAADAELARSDVALAAAFAALEAARAQVGRYSAQAYMGRHVAGMSAMLAFDNPAGFVSGLTYLEYVAQGERDLLVVAGNARTTAKNEQNLRAGRARTAEQARSAAAQALAEAAAAARAAAAAQAQQVALVRQLQQALVVAEQERAATAARYRQLQAESARIEALVRALARDGGPVVAVGLLPMPVAGWKSSDFGMRLDPFFHVWRLHAGIDLAADGGSPIRAVEAGKVFQAGWNGGYGNFTCVYHGTYRGKGLATCYAHQSAILVRLGERVRRGQLIGRVGTTGASTGNHLHFEVRLDGVPVDPLHWLPSCLC